MAKQGLEVTQKQVQKLSPLQIQTIKLIEMPVQVLEQYVAAFCADIPAEEEHSLPQQAALCVVCVYAS